MRIDSGEQACYFFNGAKNFAQKQIQLDGDPKKWRS
jgi:hypothetical protein